MRIESQEHESGQPVVKWKGPRNINKHGLLFQEEPRKGGSNMTEEEKKAIELATAVRVEAETRAKVEAEFMAKEAKRIEEEKISRYLETFKDQTQRIKNFLDEVKTKKYQKVGICSHGWPIAVMIRLLKEKKVYTFNLLNYPKCGEIITIETK